MIAHRRVSLRFGRRLPGLGAAFLAWGLMFSAGVARTPEGSAPVTEPQGVPGQSAPSQNAPGPSVPGGEWVRLGDDDHPSYLQVPEGCQAGRCPLVVVSHPRLQGAERMIKSASVSVLTRALLRANFVVLLSGDGGTNTWGSPEALRRVAVTQREATGKFRWNGRTYALGISMGGLLSLRSALPGSPYPVGGVALLDSWVNLRSAWHSAASRRREIGAAYGKDAQATAPGPHLDPLALSQRSAPTPLFVVYSPDDKVVPARSNAELLRAHAEQEVSRFVRLSGPHLGGNRFSAEVAAQLVAFYRRLEDRAVFRQTQEFPGLPSAGTASRTGGAGQ